MPEGLLDRAEGSVACGPMQVPVGKSTKSHHFKVLREAGVVRAHDDGARRYYSCGVKTSTPGSSACSTRCYAPPRPRPPQPV